MKLITAIVRPEKLDELIGVLIDNRARGLTVTEVRGFGRQLGQLAGRPVLPGVALLPKIRLDVVALDDDAETPRCDPHYRLFCDLRSRRRGSSGPRTTAAPSGRPGTKVPFR